MPKSKNRRKPKGGATSSSKRTETVNVSGDAGSATIEGATAEPKAKSSKVGPIQFFRQVRDEMRKVTWTSRNEMLVSTVMVLIMVALASVFFFAVDSVVRWLMPIILSFQI